MDLDLEPKIKSLVTRLSPPEKRELRWDVDDSGSGPDPRPEDLEVVSANAQLLSVLSSMDLDSQPKPLSELMSLITQIISLLRSMDLDSQPKPVSEILSFITQRNSLANSTDSDPESVFKSLIIQVLNLEEDPPELEPDIMPLINQAFMICMNFEPEKVICLSPQVQVRMEEGKFHVDEELPPRSNMEGDCVPPNWKRFMLAGGDTTHFLCNGCNGENHKEYNKTPTEIKHPLHPKHSLQLVSLTMFSRTRECYCCDEDLFGVFYYCSACDYAMNIACADKPPVVSMSIPKWHEHTVALFPRQAFLTCNVCALPDASSPIYMCPPCDFVVHLRCINLPRVIRISRHPHRISFTPSFDQGDWCCGVCRTEIDNDYGGYSCTKNGCLYGVHSRCATQSNVWDGIDLEGFPEEIEEEIVEPFVTISEGVIEHFIHQHHHLILDDNKGKDYNDHKECQACILPIYSGNLYSCMQCDYILHKACANLSRKIHHPIHPHMLNLVGGYTGVLDVFKGSCSACGLVCTNGFLYECSKEECRGFKLHVQCATISEPLVHGSHMDPLFLTSKPGKRRTCGVCKRLGSSVTMETFNCIKCDFALCFGCATIPQKVRYKHDKHWLMLSYGEETSTMFYWCEVCEEKINLKERFYTCDEYCCVTLHIDCLIGKNFYMKPGSSWIFNRRMVNVLPNNLHMSRPVCFNCEKRCPYKRAFQCAGFIFCSVDCIFLSMRCRKIPHVGAFDGY